MSDTRCTHDQHPAGRLSARPGRQLTPRAARDDAGRAYITCSHCDESATWNDAADAGWQTAREPYSYVCTQCLKIRTCAGCGKVLEYRDDISPSEYAPITDHVTCSQCDEDRAHNAWAAERSYERFGRDVT